MLRAFFFLLIVLRLASEFRAKEQPMFDDVKFFFSFSFPEFCWNWRCIGFPRFCSFYFTDTFKLKASDHLCFWELLVYSVNLFFFVEIFKTQHLLSKPKNTRYIYQTTTQPRQPPSPSCCRQRVGDYPAAHLPIRSKNRNCCSHRAQTFSLQVAITSAIISAVCAVPWWMWRWVAKVMVEAVFFC